MDFPWMPDSPAERLGIYPVNGITVIKWRPLNPPPEDDRYVLLRYDDLVLNETVMEQAAYNRGKFEVFSGSGEWIEIPLERIRGWTYPVFEPIPEK